MAVAAACDTRASHSTNEPVVAVRGLRKRYGRLDAVVGVDLEVYRGEIFAFLGPNGAGKTTTVEILEGFRARSEGTVSVLGGDPAHGDGAWRNRVGAVLQESQPEPGLTVRECLQLYAGTTPSRARSQRRSRSSARRRRRTRSASSSRAANDAVSTLLSL